MQISHFPQIVFKFDAAGREIDQQRVHTADELSAAEALGWQAKPLPSIRAIEAASNPVIVYPRVMFKGDGPDAEEARAHSDDERAALELAGYAVRPLPCELPDYGVAANPDDEGEAPAAAETKKKPGRPKKSEG